MVKVDSAPTNQYTFTKLRPYTKYDVGIAAVAEKEGPKGYTSFTTLMAG